METPPPEVDVAKGFQTLDLPTIVPPDIPPPVYGAVIRESDFSGRGTEGGRADGRVGAPPVSDITVAPTFTPFTVSPELLNRDEVGRALVRDYPPLLRDASIGGTTLLWFLIDEKGKVIKTTVKNSSGYAALDEAAARVASIMRFSPAKNRDTNVTVWIEIPIQFQAK
jgi:protein TonB